MVPGQPGPNLRAAAYQAQNQQQQKAASTSIIMPLYTFGIVAFFVFTIVKILLKKTKPDDKGVPLQSDPNFVEKVFKQPAPQEQKKKLGELICLTLILRMIFLYIQKIIFNSPRQFIIHYLLYCL